MPEPSALLPAEPVATDGPRSLDTQIRDAETRLVLREEMLLRRVGGLRLQAHTALRPQRLLWRALGVGAAVFALWWAWRHRPAAAPLVLRDARPARMGWMQWLAALWPMLPSHWRMGLNPVLVASVFEQLVAPAARGPAPQTMVQVDLARFAGTWHELAHLPAPFDDGRPVGQPSVRYLLVGGALRVEQRGPSRSGAMRVRPDSSNAKLELSWWPPWLRWLPVAWSPRWILFVDEPYQTAVVGHPNRRGLWLLARERRVAPERYRQLLDVAAAQGYPLQSLRRVDEPPP